MYIVEITDNPSNFYSNKMRFYFKYYSECSDFMKMIFYSNKNYSCIISYDESLESLEDNTYGQ